MIDGSGCKLKLRHEGFDGREIADEHNQGWTGGAYRCQLENGNEVRGKFLEIVKNKKIVFTWEAAPCGIALNKDTKVTMEFGPWGDDGKSSYIELLHEGFTDDGQVHAHHEGWNSVLRKIYDRARS